MGTALSVLGLAKHYGGSPAVNGLDMTVPRGAIYGFLGRNGAGKTTTMRMLLGLVRPDAGSIAIADEGGGNPARIGALIEAPTVWDNLTGRENLDVTRRLLRSDAGEVDRVLAIVGLSAAAARRAGGYSLGMRQRLGIARALIGRPRLLLLDEPTNGLDPDGIADVRRLLARLVTEEDVTVVVSSHLLDEVERVATHIGLVAAGKMVVEGPIASLRAGVSPAVEVDSDEHAVKVLAAVGLTASPVRGEPGRLIVETDAPEHVAATLVSAGRPVMRLVRREGRLEHLFSAVCGDVKEAA